MSAESVPMTEEGMAVVKREMAELEAKRPAIKKAIEEAREKGDLRENADYHAAREELGMLNARIAQLNGLLANAVLIDPAKAPTDRVALGATVTIKRAKDGAEMERTIVGAGQADPLRGRILATSPLARALVGQPAGATVTESPVCTPIGSTFSTVQMTMPLPNASAIISISSSFQPTTDSSIRISPTMLAARPVMAVRRNSSML